MPTIQPFHSQNHQTSINNYVFDYIMPKLSPNEWKVLCFIIRKTEGWGKPEDDLSLSQILDGTGIKNRTTASAAIKELEKIGYIKVGRPDDKVNSNTYSLNLEFELSIPDKEASAEIVPASTENGLPDSEASTEIVPHQETEAQNGINQASTENGLVQKMDSQIKNPTTTIPTHTQAPAHEEQAQDSIEILLKQFLISSQLGMPRKKEKLNQWRADLGDILKLAGSNLESAKKLIEDTVKALGNKYTIVGPQSIYDSCAAEWAKIQRQEPERREANGHHSGPARASPLPAGNIDQERLRKLQAGELSTTHD